jgi:fructokinase
MGEILIDFIPIDEQGKTVGFRMHPGGSPFNVAVGLARLEQHPAFVSKLARDFFGRYLLAHLECQGIATNLLRYDEQAPSTLAFVAIEDGEPVYSFYDQGAADTLLTIEDIPAVCLEETRILHFGSISLLRGTTPAAVVATVEALKGRALLSFDPNIRPGLVRDEQAYRDLIGRLVALSDIVKLSAADIDWLTPEHSYEQVASNMLAQGAALVVVTLGNMGALVLRATPDGVPQRWDIPAFVVPIADTVGAGDAFSAGLLAALAERAVSGRSALLQLDVAELERVLHFASAVSAVTCMRAGANPPTRAEVEQFLHGL